jgi:hypothetical protein
MMTKREQDSRYTLWVPHGNRWIPYISHSDLENLCAVVVTVHGVLIDGWDIYDNVADGHVGRDDLRDALTATFYKIFPNPEKQPTGSWQNEGF